LEKENQICLGPKTKPAKKGAGKPPGLAESGNGERGTGGTTLTLKGKKSGYQQGNGGIPST